MVQFAKKRGLLVVTVILFIAFKISALHYPFYWDESWSYAPGIKLMYLHGPSLMPNAIDPFYSRGHPLLFYAAAAAWMKIFGPSHFAQHSFALLLSVLLIVSVYEVALRLFNKRVATITLFLLPLQVIFYVQSTFLLPEVMIALLTLWTLYYYVTDKYRRLFVACVLLMFTKESGMVLVFVLGAHALLSFGSAGGMRHLRIRKLVAIALSFVVIGLFFLLQKKLNGWYLYPEHMGYIKFVRHVVWYKFMYALEMLFFYDNRIRIFQLLLLLAIIVAVHLKQARYALAMLPAYVVFLTIDNRFHWLPRKIMLVLLVISFLVTVRQLVLSYEARYRERTRFIYLGVVFIFAYLVFSCINFFSARYLICVMAVLFVIVAAYFDFLLGRLYPQIYKLALACLLLTAYYAFKYNNGVLDKDLGAFDAMKVQEDVVTYFERSGLYNANISSENFLNTAHLQNPMTGFLHGTRTFSNVAYDVTPATDYAIIDNIKAGNQEESMMYDTVKNSPYFQLAFRSARGPAWAEVYVRKK